MSTCEGTEAKGRTSLLHAVSMINECLPWADARTFHNLVMVKLEQGVVKWSTDFTMMANQFVDKKVRQGLKSKKYGTDHSNPRKSYGKGFVNNGSRNQYAGSNYNNAYSKPRSMYSFVCKQWNYGTCPYGERCKKMHACWTCAEAGKMGESHKAPTHEGTNTGGRQNNQRP